MKLFKKNKIEQKDSLNVYKCTYVIKTIDTMVTNTTYVIASSMQIAEIVLKNKIPYEIIGLNIESVSIYNGKVLL